MTHAGTTLWCSDPDEQLSPHFKAGEFRCKGSGGPWPVAAALVELLEKIRVDTGKGVTITSGYRTWDHNQRVGGVVSSRHLYGMAADVAVATPTSAWAVAQVAHRLGCRRIGVATTFTHIDVDAGTAYWIYTEKGTRPMTPAEVARLEGKT